LSELRDKLALVFLDIMFADGVPQEKWTQG
jgi:hypothetical protein